MGPAVVGPDYLMGMAVVTLTPRQAVAEAADRSAEVQQRTRGRAHRSLQAERAPAEIRLVQGKE